MRTLERSLDYALRETAIIATCKCMACWVRTSKLAHLQSQPSMLEQRDRRGCPERKRSRQGGLHPAGSLPIGSTGSQFRIQARLPLHGSRRGLSLVGQSGRPPRLPVGWINRPFCHAPLQFGRRRPWGPSPCDGPGILRLGRASWFGVDILESIPIR